ncbi:MAG: PQQ-binding-like beta-propeller repeat protein, partial [Chloroflexi bacterium]|nr:PQQ-binding-like beta-propeller repeat protein [Chloroflexota bacterium]
MTRYCIALILLLISSIQSVSAMPSLQASGQWPMLHNNAQRSGRGAATSGSSNLRWTFNSGLSVSSSPAIANDGTIYVGAWNNNLYAINPNGTQKWAHAVGSYISSS